MIGFLKGKIELLKRPFVIIDVNGVGYKVLVPETIYAKLSLGETLKIFTYTYVREDTLGLFGFLEAEDLKLFESLLTVSGVGPKAYARIRVDAGANGSMDLRPTVPRPPAPIAGPPTRRTRRGSPRLPSRSAVRWRSRREQ